MKKFSFELQSILTYRQFLEDEAKTELAKAISDERAIELQLEQIAQQYAAVKHQTEGKKDFAAITAANQFFALLDTRKEDLLQQLAQANLITEQKRDAFREAMQQTQSLEELRDRQLEEWKEAAAHEEELIADEVNSGKHFRR